MITVHHLNASRSTRILWLLEELSVPYEVVKHQREDSGRAPKSLAEVHPLRKSPVIMDDGKAIPESGAILEYIARKPGGGRLTLEPSDPDFGEYLFWLHFAEGSAMAPLITNMLLQRAGDSTKPMQDLMNQQASRHLDLIEARLDGRDYFAGGTLTIADINMEMPMSMARRTGQAEKYPNIARVLGKWGERAAYKKARELG